MQACFCKAQDCTHLYMFAIMASCWKLDPPECDWTLQRYFNSCLLHSILSIESCIARGGCHTAKIPLDCKKQEKQMPENEKNTRYDLHCLIPYIAVFPRLHRVCILYLAHYMSISTKRWFILLYLLLVIQCSAGRRRFFSRPWSTERTDGRCTNCNTNKCDWGKKKKNIHSSVQDESALIKEILIKTKLEIKTPPHYYFFN